MMEVYHEHTTEPSVNEDDEGILEVDLLEVEEEIARKFLAIAVFYSKKSYNPQVIFSDMLKAWRIVYLALGEKLGDYIFNLEFHRETEMRRVLDGGPWRHKGDALIVAQYDGKVRPSKINIQSIAMWIRFYDSPPAMMKEVVARQLGGQLGRYIKMDCRYPGYMRVRVEFPLNKLPVQHMKVKIKERGLMVITPCYENVPLCCFTYGRMGHAVNCEDEMQLDDQCIKFGEELRASPPKRAKEIMVKQVAASMVKPLFQVGAYGAMAKNGSHASRGSPRTCETKLDIGGKETLPFMQGSKAVQSDRLNKFISADLVARVNDMYMGAQRGLVENAMQGRDRKVRVLVGTYMTPNDTASADASMPEVEQHLATTREVPC
jgi:hypothetical protein